MSDSIKTGGPAFPCVAPDPELRAKLLEKRNDVGLSMQDIRGLSSNHGGITIRDYFAAQAMQAILGNQKLFGMILEDTGGENFKTNHAVAQNAYVIADAMIAQRE